jgi:large subunit ribosomal protein L17
MKHKVGYNRLGRKAAHRKSLHRNMVTSLFLHERIRTTKAKARAIRRTAERLVTRAGEDSVHNRRIAAETVQNPVVLAKLFTDIGPRFKTRAGGYTRMLKIGERPGDGAEMVILEFVDRGEAPEEPKKEKKKKEKEKEGAAG